MTLENQVNGRTACCDPEATNISGEHDNVTGAAGAADEDTMPTRSANGESELSAMEFRLGMTHTLEALRATNEKFHESQNQMMKMFVEASTKPTGTSGINVANLIATLGLIVMLLGAGFVFYGRVVALETKVETLQENVKEARTATETQGRIKAYESGKREALQEGGQDK